MPPGKPFWRSKTLWFNALAAADVFLGGPASAVLAPATLQALALGVNFALRLVSDTRVTSGIAPE